MRRYHAPSTPLGAFYAGQSWADCITNTAGSDFRQRQVGNLVSTILASKATWVDRDGREKLVTLDDVIIITPYNAEVFEIQQCLPGARVGTVDKFQGQRRRSPSIRLRPQAMRMRLAGWNSSTASRYASGSPDPSLMPEQKAPSSGPSC